MRLLITGGCGFLGSNLAQEAIRRGDQLIVFDNLSRSGSINNLSWLKDQGEFIYVHGDIRNANDVDRLISQFKPEAIFHLAGQVAMTTSITNPRLDFEINAGGTLNILEAVRVHAPDTAIIYSSTNKVYGDLEAYHYTETATRYICEDFPNGFPESTPLEFHSPYGCSKGAADQYMLDYSRIFGLNTVVFRHSSMYGGRQFATYDQGWVGWFCQKAVEAKRGINREPFTISGTGKQVRDILHANDMIHLYFAAIRYVNRISGQAFNIGGGISNSMSLLELFALLEGHLDVHLLYTQVAPRKSDQRTFIADITKAMAGLSWSPKVEATEGIKQMLAWINDYEPRMPKK